MDIKDFERWYRDLEKIDISNLTCLYITKQQLHRVCTEFKKGTHETYGYRVHISGVGETFVVAKNISEAMDKIESLTDANYTFIHNKSFPCII